MRLPMTPDLPARDPHRTAPRGFRKHPKRSSPAVWALAAALAFGQAAPGLRAQDLQAGSDTVSADFEAERMLSSILRSAPGGIGVVVDRVIVQVNEYILQLTGYSREELIGRSARVFYPADEDYEYVGREKYRQISETGTGTVETRWITKDGRLLDVILSSTPLDASDLGAGVVFTVTDVTEKNSTARALRSRNRDFLIGMTIFLILQLILIAALARTSAVRHRTAEELRAKTEELDRYFSSSLDLMCIADTSGRFIRLNPEWEKVLGYPIPELEGRKFLDLVHPEDLPGTLDAISRLDAQEAVLNFTNRYLCRDGTYRWIERRSRPVGSTIYAAARDITDRMDTEARL
ncbi:MAG: PAS domain S-box protein, partial [Treponema sp.]|nr:PAS domain S-box protein [Treponema sp.]